MLYFRFRDSFAMSKAAFLIWTSIVFCFSLKNSGKKIHHIHTLETGHTVKVGHLHGIFPSWWPQPWLQKRISKLIKFTVITNMQFFGSIKNVFCRLAFVSTHQLLISSSTHHYHVYCICVPESNFSFIPLHITFIILVRPLQ